MVSLVVVLGFFCVWLLLLLWFGGLFFCLFGWDFLCVYVGFLLGFWFFVRVLGFFCFGLGFFFPVFVLVYVTVTLYQGTSGCIFCTSCQRAVFLSIY